MQELQEEVDGLVLELGDYIGKLAGDGFLKKKKTYSPSDYPAIRPTYPLECHLRDKLAIHTDFAADPELLLHEKSPHQKEEEREFMLRTWKPVTVPRVMKAKGAYGRIFNRQNISYEFGEDSPEYEANPAEQYFFSEFPQLGNVLRYFETVVHSAKIDDPNGVLTVRPAKFNLDQNEIVKPIFEIYNCHQVLRYEDDLVVLLEAETRPTKDTRTGYVFQVCTPTCMQYWIQTNDRERDNYGLTLILEYPTDGITAMRLGGIPKRTNEGVEYQESIFHSALPDLDLALYWQSHLTISMHRHSFPERWELWKSCNKCYGNGTVNYDDHEPKTCDRCDGSGWEKPPSPGSTFKIDMDQLKKGMDGIDAPIPPFGYVQKEHQTLLDLERNIDRHIESAFAALHLDSLERTQGAEPETATAKLLDLQDLYSVLFQYANDIFGLMNWAVNAAGRMRYRVWNGFVINPPSELNMKTYADIVNEIETAPDSLKPALTTEAAYIRFGQSKEAKVIELKTRFDQLAGRSESYVISMCNKGYITPESICFNIYGEQIIKQLIEEDENFLELPESEQRSQVMERASALTQTKPQTDLLAQINAT